MFSRLASNDFQKIQIHSSSSSPVKVDKYKLVENNFQKNKYAAQSRPSFQCTLFRWHNRVFVRWAYDVFLLLMIFLLLIVFVASNDFFAQIFLAFIMIFKKNKYAAARPRPSFQSNQCSQNSLEYKKIKHNIDKKWW